MGQTFCSVGVCTYTGADVESNSHSVEEKVGVLLLNLGGPETLDDVQPFLFNLFADPVCLSIVLDLHNCVSIGGSWCLRAIIYFSCFESGYHSSP